MNSEAASETQYEDSKSQLSTYRKDDKIMLKRKVLTLLLALVLVVSMAVPAFAASYTDTGSWGGVIYTMKIVRGVTSASAKFTYGATAWVTVQARAIVVLDDTGENAYGERQTVSAMTTATAYMNNYGYSNSQQTMLTGEIAMVVYTGDVAGNVACSGRY